MQVWTRIWFGSSKKKLKVRVKVTSPQHSCKVNLDIVYKLRLYANSHRKKNSENFVQLTDANPYGWSLSSWPNTYYVYIV